VLPPDSARRSQPSRRPGAGIIRLSRRPLPGASIVRPRLRGVPENRASISPGDTELSARDRRNQLMQGVAKLEDAGILSHEESQAIAGRIRGASPATIAGRQLGRQQGPAMTGDDKSGGGGGLDRPGAGVGL
jgi:hypothetical protein